MIEFLNKIPEKVGIAFSGGLDSVVVYHLLRKKHDITLFFFDHKNDISYEEKEFVVNFAKNNNVKLIISENSREKLKEESKEEFWRKMRYEFFLKQNLQIISCHHLDDAVETWLWGCFNGQPQLLPYSHSNVIRPFLLCKKIEFENIAAKLNLKWYEDHTNKDVSFSRNRIRHNILPEVLKVNPGIHKVIKKKLIEKYKV